MEEASPSEITNLLVAWGKGDRKALHQLIPLVYDELHQLASRYMRREKQGHTLQTTALVNEAYCKLVDQKNVHWQNRAHFFGIAAQIMRRILVDHAKHRNRIKRGSGDQKLSLDEIAIVPYPRDAELIKLDEALTNLSTFDPQMSRIVEMKVFGGLTTEEIAEVEKVSIRTVEREWRKSKAWLYGEIVTGNK